ncbi:hypothetical protein EM595_1501 [Duffyella gerundensis]|uniref:Uncharacterized protein n=1 Tax=Duffyella gerundensis TaxID=1619313 RepID=A0A0U5L5I0_9GAMM|nr:hypothetical protein [Duffyella gerundensis]CUU23735.1 hypothetical protein EM595_1501 [Duffyella gerundensis]
MERDVENNDVVLFPWPGKRRADNRVSCGGIDLTLETGRIDEIEECARSVNLRRLLEEVNLQDGLFMTLACDHVKLENGTAGFVTFALRPETLSQLRSHTLDLDRQFWRYLAWQESEHAMAAGALVNYAQSVMNWTHAPVQIRGEQYDRITVQYYCEQSDEAEWCLDHLRHFLVSWFPCQLAQDQP